MDPWTFLASMIPLSLPIPHPDRHLHHHQHQFSRFLIRNESVPKILTNDTINLFLKLQSACCQFQTITVSECCLIKLLPYILYEKYIYILALELASPGNRHCAIVVSAHLQNMIIINNNNNIIIIMNNQKLHYITLLHCYRLQWVAR